MNKSKNNNKEHENDNSVKVERGENSKDSSAENTAENLNEEVEIKNKKIEELENEINDYKDRLLRRAAEFENFKRRTENDQLNLLKYSAESFIIKLLPIVDDFERSLQHMDSAKDVESIKAGIKLIYEKLMKTLSDQGVSKIEAEGKPFDVDYHEALMQRRAPDVASHTVLDEIEKGYMYKDRVIRHAKVVVSEELSEETPDSPSEDNS